MKKNFFILFLIVAFSSCVTDDDFDVPSLKCQNTWVTNVSLNEVIQNLMAEPKDIEGDKIIEGIVVSNDKKGSFYKELIIQDKAENPTIGLKVSINKANLSNEFPVGSHVQINANGLKIGLNKGVPTLGQGIYNDAVGQIETNVLYDFVKKTCDEPETIVAKNFENIESLLNPDNLNTYIQLNEVYFKDGGKATFHDAKSTYSATNRYLIDKEGKKISVRTSKYADFAKKQLPKGVGSLKAILSAYDGKGDGITASEYQLTLISEEEINFDPSIEPDAGGSGDSNTTYLSCKKEDFNDFEKDSDKIDPYINYYAGDKRKWKVKEFSGNKYLQINAYKAKADVKSYFIIPVDFDKADSFSFKSKDGFNKGDALSVYWVKDFSDLKNLKLTNNITSSFTISSGSTSGYAKEFVDSGEFSLAGINGKGAIVFVYEGSPDSITTTYQIDDILIKDNENEKCN